MIPAPVRSPSPADSVMRKNPEKVPEAVIVTALEEPAAGKPSVKSLIAVLTEKVIESLLLKDVTVKGSFL